MRSRRSVFQGLSFDVRAGQSLALVGPSGAGKTSVLNCVLGLLRPSSGRVLVQGSDLYRLSGGGRRRLRASAVGAVFQHAELLPELTALENVAVAGRLGGLSAAGARGRAVALLDEVGISDVDRFATEYSGGQRQRIGVARALVNEPALILADEPTASLDRETGDKVADLLYSLPERTGCALLLVTHDQRVYERADSVVRLGSEQA